VNDPILADDETLEDLQRDGLRLIQKINGFRFGEDSVFLAAFASDLVKRKNRCGLLIWVLAVAQSVSCWQDGCLRPG